METKLNRAVLYCRVSTKEQVEDGNSLVTQEKNCRDYAIKNGYEVAEIFIELGESAKTADRTELQNLFSYCANKKNNITAIIAYKLDRIARHSDDYKDIRKFLKRYGVEIKSTSEHFENNPAGRFMENIIADVAQFDNDVRAERCLGGMKQAVSEGRYVWMAPFGYSNVKINGKSTIAPNEKAEIVKFIFGQIAYKTMTVEGVRQHVISSKGFTISRTRLYNMLRNKLYVGVIVQFGKETKGAFEPIISEGLFNLVHQVLNRKYEDRTYLKENPDFPLRRFIKSSSGLYLSGCWCQGNKKKYPYYRLPGNGKMIPKDKLEKSFISFLNTFSIALDSLKVLKEKITNRLQNIASLKKIKYETLLLSESKLKEKRQILVNKSLNGIIQDDLLKEQLEIINSELWAVENELARNKTQKIDLEFIFDRLNKFLVTPGTFWKDQPIHIKRKLQKFEFPNGVTFDENNFQTQSICSIFKLNDPISGIISNLVHYPTISIKQPQTANCSILEDAELLSLCEAIQSDLILLDEILTSPN